MCRIVRNVVRFSVQKGIVQALLLKCFVYLGPTYIVHVFLQEFYEVATFQIYHGMAVYSYSSSLGYSHYSYRHCDHVYNL